MLETHSRLRSSSPSLMNDSRESTPASSHSSPSSSDFLSSEPSENYATWNAFDKFESLDMSIDRKPDFGDSAFGGLASFGAMHAADESMSLEELIQEDAYESLPHATSAFYSPLPIQLASPDPLKFDPSLPSSLPAYPSPPPSDILRQPLTVKLSPSIETQSLTSRSASPAGDRLSETPSPITTEQPMPVQVDQLVVSAPNAACPNTPVVTPNKADVSNLPILIHNVPLVGAKSRVETQIKMTLDLALPSPSGVPHYDRVGSWKYLRLPRGCATRKRPRKEGKIDAMPDDTLLMTVAVTCSSTPGAIPVTACSNCLAREAKRTERKRAARVRPQRHDSSDSDDSPGGAKGTNGRALGGIVLFNCPEVNEFHEGRIVLPVRVTCYCRHHKEKVGFNLTYTFADKHGRVVGRGITPPIMITDDHKSVVKNGAPVAATPATDSIVESSNVAQSAASSTDAKRKRRLNTTSNQDGTDVNAEDASPRAAKRRVKEKENPPKPATPTYTQAQLSRRKSPSAFSPRSSRAASTFTTAPSSPATYYAGVPLPSSEGVFLHYPVTDPSAVIPPSATPVPAEPPSQELSPPTDNLNISMDLSYPDISMSSLASVAAAAVASPPKPTDIHVSSSMLLNHSPMPLLFNPLYPTPPPAQPPPQIHRLIPASGPTHGGIEVTVLGANFLPTHRCMFGDTVATSTQMWSENTLVCLLPPSPTPGPVVVSFEGVPLSSADGSNLQLFNYLDASDRALMELALQVVGLAMTGEYDAAKNVAMRIVSGSGINVNSDGITVGDSSNSTVQQLSNLGAMQHLEVVTRAVQSRSSSDLDTANRPVQRPSTSSRDFQSVIIEFLSLLDLEDVPGRSTKVSDEDALSTPSPSGQTLLHLSAMLGFHHLLKHLVSRGIDLDARDANGYTALHFAALCGRVACARILVEGGADVEIVEARGRTAREIARWRDQVDVEVLLEEAEAAQHAIEESFEYSDVGFDGQEADDEHDVHSEEEESDPPSEGDGDDFGSPTSAATVTPGAPGTGTYLSPPLTDDSDDDEIPDPVPRVESVAVGPVKPISSDLIPPSLKSPTSLFHRTLSHLQPPPRPQWAMLPHQLQLPQLPQFPQLPQLPIHLPEFAMAFPVQMPTPSWPTGFPWQATGAGAQNNGPDEKREQSWGAYAPWFALYGNRSNGASEKPPMYTPPAEDSNVLGVGEKGKGTATATIEEEEEEESSEGSAAPSRSSVQVMMLKPKSTSTRRRAAAAVRERRAQEYRSESSSQERDHMLFSFWLPILLIVVAWGLYQGVPIVIMTAQEMITTFLPPIRV